MDEAGGLSVGEQVWDEVDDEVSARPQAGVLGQPLVCPRIGHLHGRESDPKGLASLVSEIAIAIAACQAVLEMLALRTKFEGWINLNFSGRQGTRRG